MNTYADDRKIHHSKWRIIGLMVLRRNSRHGNGIGIWNYLSPTSMLFSDSCLEGVGLPSVLCWWGNLTLGLLSMWSGVDLCSSFAYYFSKHAEPHIMRCICSLFQIVASEKIQNSQESSGLDYLNASLINEDFADKNISSKGKYLCSTIDKEGLPHNHV